MFVLWTEFFGVKDVAWSEADIKFTSFHRVPKLYPGSFLTVEVTVLFMYVTGKYTHAMFLLVMLISFHYPGNEVKSEFPF